MKGQSAIRYWILIAIFSMCWGLTNAQRPSKEELDLETLYIEATRAKLLGDNEKAISLFKQILEEDEENDVVYYELARVYLLTEAPKEALDAIQKAVKLKPRNIWYQEEFAAAHAANDDYVSAAQVYKRLVAQEPREQKFYYDLAFHYVKNNDIKEAIAVFNQHEKQFGVSEEVISRKFNLYKTLGDRSKAENELSKLVKAFPSETRYAIGLAKFYEDSNNTAKAKSTYQKILKADPNNIEAQVALNNLNGGKSRESNETMWSDASVNIDIKISKIIPAINGLPGASKDKQEQIIAITNQITQTHPSEAKAFAVHGDVLNFSGRYEEAIVAYEGALELEKNVFSVWDQLLLLYKDQFQMKTLLDRSEMALDYFPNEPSIYYLNGLAANSLKQYSDAVSALMQADIMSRSNANLNAKVKIAMAASYAGMGKSEKANTLLSEGVELDSKDPEIISMAGEVYTNLDKPMSAQELFMRGMDRSKVTWQAQYADAKLAYTLEEYQKAMDIIKKIDEPDGAFHVKELRGNIFFQLGDIDAAVEAWKASKTAGNPDRNLDKKITSRQI